MDIDWAEQVRKTRILCNFFARNMVLNYIIWEVNATLKRGILIICETISKQPAKLPANLRPWVEMGRAIMKFNYKSS